jgi:hypothetical protein
VRWRDEENSCTDRTLFSGSESRSDVLEIFDCTEDAKSKTDTGGSFNTTRSIIKAAERVSSTLKLL